MKTMRCFHLVNWNPDRAELRRFAVAMIVGFAVLGALVAWKTGLIGPKTRVLWAAGVVLAGAANIPYAGRLAYLVVYVPASLIGWVISHVLLTAVFFGVFTPVGLIIRVAGIDPMMLRSPAGGGWKPFQRSKLTDRYYSQY